MSSNDPNYGKMKKWVVQQMFAIENQTLDKDKAFMIFDLIEKNESTPFIIDCFRTFNHLKSVLERHKADKKKPFDSYFSKN